MLKCGLLDKGDGGFGGVEENIWDTCGVGPFVKGSVRSKACGGEGEELNHHCSSSMLVDKWFILSSRMETPL